MNAPELLSQLHAKEELNSAQLEWLAEYLLDPAAPDADKAALLRALNQKGETVGEIVGLVKVFLRYAIRPPLDAAGGVDVCGTGGDKLDMFNVSTTSMFVLAGGGATVLKHGNRGITSKSGGADVLEALGIRIDLTPQQFAACVEETGIGFLFAPLYHPAFKAIAPVRKQLAAEGLRTVFNILGPLLNPLQPPFQLVGVPDPALPEKYVRILSDLGRERAWVVHGTSADGRGMDELSTSGHTLISRLESRETSHQRFHPSEHDIPLAALEDLKGGDAKENAAILKGILAGEIRGPKRDLVLVNAAAGFQVAGKASTWGEALALARFVLDDGAALNALESMQRHCALL